MTATKISNERAKEVLKSQFAKENVMTVAECAKLLGKTTRTIANWCKKSCEKKRNGEAICCDDFPAMQNEPHSPYTIFFNELKIWCNRKGMRV